MLLGLPEFEFHSAESVREACVLLVEHGDEARVLAGGTDLLVTMKHRQAVPRHLVNIKRIPGLDGIGDDGGGGLRIGALATIQSIEDSPVIGKGCAALSQAAAKLGTSQIRNLGTIGGNLGNASPSAEFAPPLLTLGASVACVGPEGERTIALDDFFVAPGKTSLQRDEILTEVRVPPPPPGARGIYLKHSLRKMDVSMAAAALLVVLDGDVLREVRIALGAVAPTPFRARNAEAVIAGARLTGSAADGELLDETARTAVDESSPIDDFRGYADYRRNVISMLVRQGLEETIAEAGA